MTLELRWRHLFRQVDGVTLRTPRLVLRPPRMGDAADFFAYAQDERVARYVLWYPHKSLREARGTLRAIRGRSRAQGAMTFAICRQETGQFIGIIGPVWLDWGSRACEVGFSLAHEAWGQGLMTEALKAFLRYAFDGLQLNRVEGQHDLRNPASGRVMKKAGMMREGKLLQRLYYKGEYADVALYAALRASWQRENQPAKGIGRHCL